MKKMIFVFSLFFLFSAPAAFAANGDRGDIEVGPYIGAGFPDSYSGTEPKDGPIFGGSLGYSLDSKLGVEISAHRLISKAATDDANFDSYRLNFLWNFKTPSEKVRPFITGGLGFERADFANTTIDQTELAPNFGAGLKWHISELGGLRLDGRYIPVNVGGAVNQLQHNFESFVTVFLTFGKKAEKAAPAAAPAAKPADSDGDGVIDPLDKCPNTPAGEKVNSFGCPPKDGDSDHDGVKDSVDKCPGTPKGEKVDDKGCPEKAAKARGVLKGVNFKSGSAELTDEAKKVLDEVASTLNEFPNVVAEIQGHTDSTGNPDNNKKLSQARAEAVMRYLVVRKVKSERLTAKGYGQEVPIADNKTPQGRRLNRRVEMKWAD